MTTAVLMQVLTAGQELVFDYQGDMYILRPLSMMIAASQDKSAQQGLLTDTTAMTFEAAPGNYGKAAPLALIPGGLEEQHIPVCSRTPGSHARTADRKSLLHSVCQGLQSMPLHQGSPWTWHCLHFNAIPGRRVRLEA